MPVTRNSYLVTYFDLDNYTPEKLGDFYMVVYSRSYFLKRMIQTDHLPLNDPALK